VFDFISSSPGDNKVTFYILDGITLKSLKEGTKRIYRSMGWGMLSHVGGCFTGLSGVGYERS